jgi:hypothetical protein
MAYSSLIGAHMPNSTFGNNTLFFSIARIKPARKLLDALKHNKRQIQTELGAFSHIAPEKTNLNYCLAGCSNPEDGYETMRDLIKQYSNNKRRQLQKNAVVAAEMIFSIPFHRGDIDHLAFFEDCLDWCKNEFKGHPLVSADVHLDEACKHMHVLFACVLPDRLLGSKSISFGKPFKFRNFRFFDEVAKHYGLQAPSIGLNKMDRAKLGHKVLLRLESLDDPLLKSTCFNSLRRFIENDPVPFASELGIEFLPSSKPVKNKGDS